jgi:hypothetical protein
MDYFSKNIWNINPSGPVVIANIPAGCSETRCWNVTTSASNSEALFTVTVAGSGSSSLISAPQYQTRSNQISIGC